MPDDRVEKQPGIACDLYRDFVAGPQFLDELPQILQLPLGHIRPLVLQPNTTSEPVAVKVDADISSLHVALLVVCASRSSRLTLRRSPFSYSRSRLRLTMTFNPQV